MNMEISRITTATQVKVNENRSVGEAAAEHGTRGVRRALVVVDLPLERVQASLGSGGEVDHERVAALKQALERGDVSTDPGKLAASMLAYHRGNAL